MKAAILTSSLGGAEKIDGKHFPAKLLENNGELEMVRSFWTENARVLFITASPDDQERNDGTVFCMSQAFAMSGLSVSEVLMCDRRTEELVNEISKMDVVILTGGHVPTENAFFQELALREKLKEFDGLLITWSAGSMNCADLVYAGPELPGEAVDPDYQRWIPGLGITKTNIFPHLQDLRDEMIDGMRVVEDVTFSDSMGHEILALNDGSYLLVEETGETVFGEAYRILDGEMTRICTNGGSVRWRP